MGEVTWAGRDQWAKGGKKEASRTGDFHEDTGERRVRQKYFKPGTKTSLTSPVHVLRCRRNIRGPDQEGGAVYTGGHRWSWYGEWGHRKDQTGRNEDFKIKTGSSTCDHDCLAQTHPTWSNKAVTVTSKTSSKPAVNRLHISSPDYKSEKVKILRTGRTNETWTWIKIQM